MKEERNGERGWRKGGRGRKERRGKGREGEKEGKKKRGEKLGMWMIAFTPQLQNWGKKAQCFKENNRNTDGFFILYYLPGTSSLAVIHYWV